MRMLKTFAVFIITCGSFCAQQWGGNVNLTDPIVRDGKVSIGTNSAFLTLNVGGYINVRHQNMNDGGVIFGSANKFNEYLIHYDNGDLNPFLPAGLHLRPIAAGAKTHLFLSNDYKVGIGTAKTNCSSCNDYRLFVKDGIKTEKVRVEIAASNGWADYVFKRDYKLLPLKDLEQFIKVNGHLPEVPTTEQAIAEGIELKEMNILLLKKIEELTLYTLEQQKLIEEQQRLLVDHGKRLLLLEKNNN